MWTLPAINQLIPATGTSLWKVGLLNALVDLLDCIDEVTDSFWFQHEVGYGNQTSRRKGLLGKAQIGAVAVIALLIGSQGRPHAGLRVLTIGLNKFLAAIQILPVVLETSNYVRPCALASNDGPGVPRPRVILALVPCHVLFAASLVLLRHARFDAVDMYLDKFRSLLRLNRNQRCEGKKGPECCTLNMHNASSLFSFG